MLELKPGDTDSGSSGVVTCQAKKMEEVYKRQKQEALVSYKTSQELSLEKLRVLVKQGLVEFEIVS